MPIPIVLRVNGQTYHLETSGRRTLASALRDDLGLTGTKVACGVGVCGVCAVLLDGELVSSCLVLAAAADGRDVTTIEGVAADGALTPLQQAFIEHGGFQCGICTPGQIVTATALLRERPDPTDDDIREWMTGSLCRCTGYQSIARAIRAAAASA